MAAPAAKRGEVRLARMHFIGRKVIQADVPPSGFKMIFPNKDDGGRDGGMATLSPMRLGPVKHGQAGLPDALLLENFWQQSKQYADETDAEFVSNQKKMFADATPHRHKRRGVKPLGWVWVDPKTGRRHVLGWVEARQFYCNYYERLVRSQPEWLELERMVAAGQSVCICGYDARDVRYDDPNYAFAHEAVLATMLRHPTQESEWPWRKAKTFDF